MTGLTCAAAPRLLSAESASGDVSLLGMPEGGLHPEVEACLDAPFLPPLAIAAVTLCGPGWKNSNRLPCSLSPSTPFTEKVSCSSMSLKCLLAHMLPEDCCLEHLMLLTKSLAGNWAKEPTTDLTEFFRSLMSMKASLPLV